MLQGDFVNGSAGGTRLAPTETKCRPAARVKYPAALLRYKFDAP